MSGVNTLKTAEGSAYILLENALSIGFGNPVNVGAANKVIEATVTGSGTVNAVIEIYGNTRPNNTDGILIATITLSGTAPQRDGFAFDAPWPYIYARVLSISGTGAAVTVDLAV